jgi:hypothetical protein|tara:strand:- start:230 stop:496 length:267 start_codon:yes stop_codon:yes gene_type:complete
VIVSHGIDIRRPSPLSLFFDKAFLGEFLEGFSQFPIFAVSKGGIGARGLQATFIAQVHQGDGEDCRVAGLDLIEEVDIEFEGGWGEIL